MATDGTEASSNQIKQEDLVKFLNIFSSEFNNDRLHDRVLVFEIIDELKEAGEVSEGSGDLRSSAAEESSDDGATSDDEDVEFETVECYPVVFASIPKEPEEEEKGSQAETSENNQNTSDAGKVDLDEWKRISGKVVKDVKLMIKKEEERERVGNEGKESDEEMEFCPEAKETKTTKLFVHSSWLAVHSSYFKALFFSGMKESHQKEVVMKVKQSELQAHLTLIEAIYQLDILNDKDCRLVVDVLLLADKYDVNFVFKKCKCVLISSSISVENCEYIMKIISGISECADVLDAMEEFLVKEFSPLDKTWLLKKFCTLSKVSLKLLLGSDKLLVESENTVFVALMTWMNLHRKEGIREGRSLLSLVRFELMTVNFMHDVVRHDSMAKQLDGFNEFLHNGLAYHAFSPARLRELEDKPISRSTYRPHDSGPTFSWVIDEDEQGMLIDNGTIHSSSFWLKGYQMKFKLGYKPTPQSCYSIFLYVQNINEKAHVDISWEAKSDLFAYLVGRDKVTYTRSSKGFGFRTIESNIAPSQNSNTLPQTIDFWVQILK